MPPATWTAGWIAIGLVLVVVAIVVWQSRRTDRAAPLPTEWAVTPRPVFNADERRVYRLLREALPHHVILAKLPLVRFCQPSEPGNVRYWYDLLGSNHVAFAVCSANGRVLAAIDLDSERSGSGSRRALLIKQSVLNACRVRYLRCPVEQLPTVAELQLLVPQQNGPARGPQPAQPQRLHAARENLASVVATRRAERTALWQDSTLFQDSFFAPDSRMDGTGNSEFGAFSHAPSARRAADADEVAGVVVDPPPASRA